MTSDWSTVFNAMSIANPNSTSEHVTTYTFIIRAITKVRQITKQYSVLPGVTGHNIGLPLAGIYPGLKRPRLDYSGVYYGLSQFIRPQAKLYTHDINHDINNVKRYTQELFNLSTSY